jgi:hypothetical protein
VLSVNFGFGVQRDIAVDVLQQLTDIAAREWREDLRRHMLDQAATYERGGLNNRTAPLKLFFLSPIFPSTNYKIKNRPLLRFLLIDFGRSLLPTRDLRRQRHRELAVGCSGIMDPVPLQEISRYHWVKNNDADTTPPQPINDGRNISGTLLLRPEETEIISARLQDDDIGVVGDSAIDAAEHAAGSITADAGAGDHSIDAALLEDGLQSCREGIQCTNAPTRCIAGANHNNFERTGMT